MSYLLDRKLKRKKIISALVVGIILVFLFFVRDSVFSGLSYSAQIVFRPFLFLSNSFGEKINNISVYFSSKKSLEQEIRDLKLQLDADSARIVNADSVFAENEKLKEILDRNNEKLNLVLAAILGKPNQSIYDTMIVDVGTNQNIKTGNTVYALGNIPIGRVDTVYEKTAKVILFSASGEKNQVTIKDVSFELVGRGGGNFEMTLPRDAVMQKGDQALLPGINSFVVAIVETVISDPRDSFQKALLVTPTNIEQLRYVEIEK